MTSGLVCSFVLALGEVSYGLDSEDFAKLHIYFLINIIKRCFLRKTSGDAPLHQQMVAEVVPP